MPGSETALEELMCHMLGDFVEEGFEAKLADDLYCGGNTAEELLANWRKVLEALHRCGLNLAASKTTIVSNRQLSLDGFSKTVTGLRSFIGAYKVL